MQWHFKLKLQKSPHSTQILHVPHEAAGADLCRARPAPSRFPSKYMQFLVNTGMRWLARKPWWCQMCGHGPPSPGTGSAPAAAASPRWLRRRGQLAGPPRHCAASAARSPLPGPQKREFSDLAMQQINKWMELENLLERAAGRASQSEGEEKRFCRRLAGWVPVRIMISMLPWFHWAAHWGT